MSRALITGITGQDGILLGRFLHERGYDVLGLSRDDSSRTELVQELIPGVELLRGDLTDQSSLLSAVAHAEPDEVYNLAATSFVGHSWELAEQHAEATALGALRMLEAVRLFAGRDDARIRVYQASTSEMFGLPERSPQNEETPLRPRSPYGVAKTFAHHMVGTYRASYGLFACAGILYNHESEFRGEQFVTRKITRAAARIAAGQQKELALGSLEACRDWGFAGDYVQAMWTMLQQPKPDDYVVATGVQHSVRDIVATAFRTVGIDDWQPFVRCDSSLRRPVDSMALVGDASKARRVLGWHPVMTFEQLIRRMTEHDLVLTENVPR